MYKMATLSQNLITFPALRYMDFAPVQDAIGNIGEFIDITAVPGKKYGVCGLQIDHYATKEQKQEIFKRVSCAVKAILLPITNTKLMHMMDEYLHRKEMGLETSEKDMDLYGDLQDAQREMYHDVPNMSKKAIRVINKVYANM